MNDQDMTTASYEAQTYPRLNLKDFTLDENNLERDCPLDNGRHQKLPEERRTPCPLRFFRKQFPTWTSTRWQLSDASMLEQWK